MAYPPSLEDTSASPIPISQGYADNQNKFVAMGMSPFTHTDGNSNESGAALMQPALSTNGLPTVAPGISQRVTGVTGSGAKTLAIAFANANLAGNSIVVCLGMGEVESGSSINLAVTDSQGNTYTQAVKGTNSTTQEAAIFYAANILPGSNTVTITIAGGSSSNTAIAAEAYEVTGLITVSSLLVDASSGNNNTGTAVSTSNLTPNFVNDLGFMAIASAGGTITAGSGWYLDSGTLAPTGGNVASFGSQSRLQLTQGAVVPAATLGTSNAWAACAVLFRSMHLPTEGTHVTQGGMAEYVGSAAALNADLIPMIDVSAYKGFSLQIGSGVYSGTLTIQCSNDGVNWGSALAYRLDTQGLTSTIISASSIFLVGSPCFHYLRVRMTSYTSGTATAILELYTFSPAIPTPTTSVSISGSVSTTQVTTISDSNALISSASYSSTQTSSTQTNFSYRGLRIHLNVTVIGTGSLTLSIQGDDSTTSTWYTIFSNSSPIVANGFYEFSLYPGVSGTNTANYFYINDALPRSWRVSVAGPNGTTFAVAYGLYL